MRKLRILHRAIGRFSSPATPFFAFTGALQTFDLHSPKRSTGYLPPTWLAEMAQLHKKQTLDVTEEKGKPNEANSVSDDTSVHRKAERPRKSGLPLKCFVVAMLVELIVTTFLGIFIAFRFGISKSLIWGLLAAGTDPPKALIFF